MGFRGFCWVWVDANPSCVTLGDLGRVGLAAVIVLVFFGVWWIWSGRFV